MSLGKEIELLFQLAFNLLFSRRVGYVQGRKSLSTCFPAKTITFAQSGYSTKISQVFCSASGALPM